MSVLDSIKHIPNHPSSTRRNGRKLSDIRWVVIHTMESQEGLTTAEDTAAWLSRNGPRTPAGVHYCVDRNSIVQMGDWRDVTAGAGGTIPGHRGANFYSIHIELAGRAGQTKEQWRDAASVATVENCATLCREILVPQLQIPVRHLTVPEVQALGKGFCGHIDITKATKRNAGHWDPGPNFPWQTFLSLIEADDSETSIRIFVAGVELKGARGYQDSEGATYGPLRVLAEALGWQVAAKDGEATLTFGATGQTQIRYENQNGTGFVPVRELGSKLGVPVVWDADAQAVRLG